MFKKITSVQSGKWNNSCFFQAVTFTVDREQSERLGLQISTSRKNSTGIFAMYSFIPCYCMNISPGLSNMDLILLDFSQHQNLSEIGTITGKSKEQNSSSHIFSIKMVLLSKTNWIPQEEFVARESALNQVEELVSFQFQYTFWDLGIDCEITFCPPWRTAGKPSYIR